MSPGGIAALLDDPQHVGCSRGAGSRHSHLFGAMKLGMAPLASSEVGCARARAPSSRQLPGMTRA